MAKALMIQGRAPAQEPDHFRSVQALQRPGDQRRPFQGAEHGAQFLHHRRRRGDRKAQASRPGHAGGVYE